MRRSGRFLATARTPLRQMGCCTSALVHGWWWGVALGTVVEGSTFFSFFSFPVRQRFALTVVTLDKVITSLAVIKCHVVSYLSKMISFGCAPVATALFRKVASHGRRSRRIEKVHA